MIYSENNEEALNLFKELISRSDEFLNSQSCLNETYFLKRSGTLLEEDVCNSLQQCAIGTPFEGTIKLVSGTVFPDIIANRFYGVEVKSTNKNHWQTIGGSILESTRRSDVQRIFLTFGKLASPVQFISRPYEECLSEIAVTHYPRYRIDMNLPIGQTIFDKIGLPYDTLRNMEHPVKPIAEYYKRQLKDGESLWWADSDESTAISPTVRLWSALVPNEQDECISHGFAFFPELLGPWNNKYNRFALWLTTACGIVHTNIRDSFSAGGKVTLYNMTLPAVLGRLFKYGSSIVNAIHSEEEQNLKEYWGVNIIKDNRLQQWCDLILKNLLSNPRCNQKDVLVLMSSFYDHFNQVRYN